MISEYKSIKASANLKCLQHNQWKSHIFPFNPLIVFFQGEAHGCHFAIQMRDCSLARLFVSLVSSPFALIGRVYKTPFPRLHPQPSGGGGWLTL